MKDFNSTHGELNDTLEYPWRTQGSWKSSEDHGKPQSTHEEGQSIYEGPQSTHGAAQINHERPQSTHGVAQRTHVGPQRMELLESYVGKISVTTSNSGIVTFQRILTRLFQKLKRGNYEPKSQLYNTCLYQPPK